MALADVIELISKYKVGDASTDDITNTQLTLLQSMTSARVTRTNPGFTGDELLLYTAYHCLDAYESGHGAQIIEKQVKDTRWKVARSTSTSSWMDKALQMVSEFKSANGFTVLPTGVARCDSLIRGFDNTEITQYGDPSNGL